MLVPHAAVNAHAGAQGVEVGPHPGVFAPGHGQGVGGAIHAPLHAKVQAGKLGVEELEVKAGVMNHQPSRADKGNKIRRLVGEQGLVVQESVAQPVDAGGLFGHVAFGVEVAVKLPPRGEMVDKLNTAHLHHAVPGGGVKAGGFGIEDDFAEHVE